MTFRPARPRSSAQVAAFRQGAEAGRRDAIRSVRAVGQVGGEDRTVRLADICEALAKEIALAPLPGPRKGKR